MDINNSDRVSSMCVQWKLPFFGHQSILTLKTRIAKAFATDTNVLHEGILKETIVNCSIIASPWLSLYTYLSHRIPLLAVGIHLVTPVRVAILVFTTAAVKAELLLGVEDEAFIGRYPCQKQFHEVPQSRTWKHILSPWIFDVTIHYYAELFSSKTGLPEHHRSMWLQTRLQWISGAVIFCHSQQLLWLTIATDAGRHDKGNYSRHNCSWPLQFCKWRHSGQHQPSLCDVCHWGCNGQHSCSKCLYYCYNVSCNRCMCTVLVVGQVVSKTAVYKDQALRRQAS